MSDTKLTALATGTFADYVYGTQGGVSKKFVGFPWHNVKDFGAIGDGSNNDTDAIQAAVDWTSDADRGVIFFPPGTYKTISPITFNADGLSIIFQGVGMKSKILGSFNDFLFKRTLNPYNPTGTVRIFEDLYLVNSHSTGGGIRFGSSIGCAVRNCAFNANRCLTFADAAPAVGASQSFVVDSCAFSRGSGGYSGSYGINAAANGLITCCDLSGLETGVWVSATSGMIIQSCRMEVNGTGIFMGSDVDGISPYLSGCVVLGGTFESNGTAIRCAGVGTFLAGMIIQGFPNAAPNGTNPQYGIRCVANGTKFGTLSGIIVGGSYDVAAVHIEDSTDRAGLVFSSVSASNASVTGGVVWDLPIFPATAEFINCNVLPTYLFANLPSGTASDGSANRREGDEYSITDANISGKVLGDSITAGGSTGHIKVRYNGSAWKWASN